MLASVCERCQIGYAKKTRWYCVDGGRKRGSGVRNRVREAGGQQEGEGGGVWTQSHEGDVSTCHVVVITCAAVAARLVVITLIGRGGARGRSGRGERRSWKTKSEGSQQSALIGFLSQTVLVRRLDVDESDLMHVWLGSKESTAK